MASSRAIASAALVGVVAAVAPARADAPVPSTPIEKRSQIEAGAALFALPYLASVFAASDSYAGEADSAPAHGELWIPVAGPFLSLDSRAGRDTLLVADGLAQAAGLALLVYAIATPICPCGGHRATVVPLRSGGASGVTSGVALVGRF